MDLEMRKRMAVRSNISATVQKPRNTIAIYSWVKEYIKINVDSKLREYNELVPGGDRNHMDEGRDDQCSYTHEVAATALALLAINVRRK